MKRFKVYWNIIVENNMVADFDTLDEAKHYCDENTQGCDECTGDYDEGCSDYFHMRFMVAKRIFLMKMGMW